MRAINFFYFSFTPSEKISLLLMILSSTGLFSCGNDGGVPEPDFPEYHFVDQPLQGKIEGQPWAFIAGKMKPGQPVNIFSYHNVLISDDTCTTSSQYHISHSATEVEPKLYGVGPYYLNVNFVNTQTTGETITANRGAIEIISIDYDNNLLHGRMDAFYDSSNYVNGNFTIKICPQ